jgi:hypothetical protein
LRLGIGWSEKWSADPQSPARVRVVGERLAFSGARVSSVFLRAVAMEATLFR